MQAKPMTRDERKARMLTAMLRANRQIMRNKRMLARLKSKARKQP